MLGLTADKAIILVVFAAFLLGPSRLPAAAAWLGRLVRELRALAEGARSRAREELGDEFDDIDWQKLDPRRYDPRRIIVEALRTPAEGDTSTTSAVSPAADTPARPPNTREGTNQ